MADSNVIHIRTSSLNIPFFIKKNENPDCNADALFSCKLFVPSFPFEILSTRDSNILSMGENESLEEYNNSSTFGPLQLDLIG